MIKCLPLVWASLFLAWAPQVRADRGVELYESARATYYSLVESGPAAQGAETWKGAARQFALVRVADPGSTKADDSLYMEGLCGERAYAISAVEADREASAAAYLALSQNYPGSNLADDALLRAGRIRELQRRPGDAETLYRRVLTEFPARDMATVARRRLDALGDTGSLREVRSWSGTSYTRVVLDLDRIVPFQAKSLPANPQAGKSPRIFLDLARARVGAVCPPCTEVADGLVSRVRTAQHDPATVRVVLDLTAPASFRAFPLDAPPRIVVDVFRHPQDSDIVAGLIGNRVPPASPPGVPLNTGPKRPFRIVVDPGHGGNDPGAVGPGGLLEKDVALAVARELAVQLPRKLDCVVKLTRDDDRFLPLEQRTAVANAFGADLFLSVHANASRSSRAEGIETYYLDRTSDRASRKLAARENASTEADLAEMEHLLTDIILSTKIRDSRRLALQVQQALVAEVSHTYGPVRDLGVKRGPFYVLTGAMMPAILIETSFITHPLGAKRLASSRFRERVASAMAAGVARYVQGS